MNGMIDTHHHVPATAIAEAAASGIAAAVLTPIGIVAVMAQSPTPTAAQRWLSWFPGGEALGVNTLASLRADGIYAISAATASSLRVGADDTADETDATEKPAC